MAMIGMVCTDYFLCDECVAGGVGSRSHRADHPTQAIVPSSYSPSDVDEVDETGSLARSHEIRGVGALSQSGCDTESQLSSMNEYELDFGAGEERAFMLACERDLPLQGHRGRRRVPRRELIQLAAAVGGVGRGEAATLPEATIVPQRHPHSSGASSPSTSSSALGGASMSGAASSTRRIPSSSSRSKRTSFDTLDALSQFSLSRKQEPSVHSEAHSVHSENRSDSCAGSRKDKMEDKDDRYGNISRTESLENGTVVLSEKNTHRVLFSESAIEAKADSPTNVRPAQRVIGNQRLRMAFVRKLLLSTVPEIRDISS